MASTRLVGSTRLCRLYILAGLLVLTYAISGSDEELGSAAAAAAAAGPAALDVCDGDTEDCRSASEDTVGRASMWKQPEYDQPQTADAAAADVNLADKSDRKQPLEQVTQEADAAAADNVVAAEQQPLKGSISEEGSPLIRFWENSVWQPASTRLTIELSIQASLPNGTEVYRVIAMDDENPKTAVFSYELVDGSDNNGLFLIDNVSGSVTVAGTIEYNALNSSAIQLNIAARELEPVLNRTGRATLSVSVQTTFNRVIIYVIAIVIMSQFVTFVVMLRQK